MPDRYLGRPLARMARIARFMGPALAALTLWGCSSDLDVTAPYKNITVVYALLDPLSTDGTTPETLHFVKINKAFLGDGDAYTYAQIPDSTEFTDAQLQAHIEKLDDNGNVTASYELRDTIMDGRDPGIFNGPQHKLYCFNAALDPTARYRLNAVAKGEQITAVTPLVENFSPNPVVLASNFKLALAVNNAYGSPLIRWTSGPNGKRYEFSYRFKYDEIALNGDTAHLSFTEYVGTVVATGSSGNETMELNIDGEGFYQSIAAHVHPDDNVTKRVFRGVDLVWAVAAPDLHTYLQLANPISGIVEEHPQFSNVTNGYGLFTSRFFREVKDRPLNDPSEVELVEGQYTADLQFCIPGASAPLGCD